MKHLAILFVVAGIVGALITWGTTWWLVADFGPTPPGMIHEDTYQYDVDSGRIEYPVLVGRMSGLALVECGLIDSNESYSWYRDGNEDATAALEPYIARLNDDDGDVVGLGMVYQGVPFSAMKSVVEYTTWDPEADVRTYRVIRGIEFRDTATTEPWDAVLPTSIVWDGFLSNSALYGLAAMLVYGVAAVFWKWARRWATTP